MGKSFGRSRMGWKTIPGVWDWPRDPPGGPEQVGGPSRTSGKGRGTTFWRSGTGRWTVKEVRDWLRDPPKGMVRVGRSF